MNSPSDRARRAQLNTFLAVSALLSAIGTYCALSMAPGSVWDDHLQAGQKLLAGVAPEVPAYPIWGFSLLAGLFGPSLIWLQAVGAVVVAGFWFHTLTRKLPVVAGWRSGHGFAVLLALAMAPWFAVAASYYSNSMACILGLAATCLLWRSLDSDRWLPWTLASALTFGIAANIRTEFLLITLLLAIAIVAAAPLIAGSTWLQRAVRAAVFLAVTFVALVPWSIYTHATTGEYRLTSSNSSASYYLGLGVLPNNPWGVVLNDDFVDKLVQDKVGAKSAPTLAGELYLKDAFKQAIAAHPWAFAKRVVYGWRVMLLQGFYVPNMRLIWAPTPEDSMLMSLAVERFKQAASLSVNWYAIKEAERLGVDLKDLRAEHYALIGAETLLRAVYVLLMLGLVVAFLWRFVSHVLRRRPLGFADAAAAVYLVHMFFVAGFIQTSPRHSTLVLPALLGALALAWLREPPRPQKSVLR